MTLTDDAPEYVLSDFLWIAKSSDMFEKISKERVEAFLIRKYGTVTYKIDVRLVTGTDYEINGIFTRTALEIFLVSLEKEWGEIHWTL